MARPTRFRIEVSLVAIATLALACEDERTPSRSADADAGLSLVRSEGRRDPPIISPADPEGYDGVGNTLEDGGLEPMPGSPLDGGVDGTGPTNGPSLRDGGRSSDFPGLLPDGGVGSGPAGPLYCTFRALSDFSQEIPTVALVDFEVTADPVEWGFIEYGPTEDYGLTAPVDVSAPSFRTVLLGLGPLAQNHYRVTIGSGDQQCTSQNFLFASGPVLNAFTEPNVDVVDETAVAPGFIISERFAGGDGGQIFILDHRGEMVWSYQSKVNNLSRAKMSYDGMFMYAQTVNVAGADGQIAKISMDGLSEELLSFPAAHHDFAVLPDGALALIRKTADGCDEIVRSIEGGIETIFQVADAYPAGAELGTEHEACHTNAIHHHPSDDSFTFSDLNNNALVKITAQGDLVWVLGGPHSHFTGDGAEWERQHGHQLLNEKRLLLFVNGPLGSEEPSEAVEVELNERTMVARRVWSYSDSHSSDTFGDVQRLPNGNTLVTFSNAGVIQQVDPDGNVVQEFTFPLGGATGYSEFRESLYGPPLR